MVIAGILYIWCWKVLSWAIILVAKSARGDCETALASLLGFLIGFVIADLHRVKTAWENLGFVVEDSELLTVTLLSVFTAVLSGEGDLALDPSLSLSHRGPPLQLIHTCFPVPIFHSSLSQSYFPHLFVVLPFLFTCIYFLSTQLRFLICFFSWFGGQHLFEWHCRPSHLFMYVRLISSHCLNPTIARLLAKQRWHM